MQDGIDKLAELFPNCFFRDNHLRRPLKIGIRDDITARHPDLRAGLIVGALKTYTRCVPYWDALKNGAARIDLDGHPAGGVTLEDAQHALVQIAKAARRAAAKEIEVRKAAAAPPVTRSVPQVEHVPPSPVKSRSESAPVADLPSNPVPAGQVRLGLAGLKAAAQARRVRLLTAE
jgi:ProP effector